MTPWQQILILFGGLCAIFGVCLVLCIQSLQRWWDSDKNDDDDRWAM